LFLYCFIFCFVWLFFEYLLWSNCQCGLCNSFIRGVQVETPLNASPNVSNLVLIHLFQWHRHKDAAVSNLIKFLVLDINWYQTIKHHSKNDELNSLVITSLKKPGSPKMTMTAPILAFISGKNLWKHSSKLGTCKCWSSIQKGRKNTKREIINQFSWQVFFWGKIMERSLRSTKGRILFSKIADDNG
jgi:hypothetical protein